MALTKIPVIMLEAGEGSSTGDKLTVEGTDVVEQPDSRAQNAVITGGLFDPTSGVLTLNFSDSSALTVTGFLTNSNIGVGPEGPPGPAGKPGANGRHGIDGRPGTPGCTGPRGYRGPMGPTGPAGPHGGGGSTGPAGPSGPTGPTGPAGEDGKTPEFGKESDSAFEKYEGSSIKMWGRYTVDDSELFQRVVFPTAFNNDNPRAVILQFVNAGSPVRNAVRISALNRANFELMVNQNLLPKEPDGNGDMQPVAATGWDFYWFVIGAEMP